MLPPELITTGERSSLFVVDSNDSNKQILPILLSWRLEFLELLTKFTSDRCPRTDSLATMARHNSFGLVRSTVLPREIQISSPVY